MSIRIEYEPIDALYEYGKVSIAFTVESKFIIEPVLCDPSTWNLREVKVSPPYVKDYDEGEPPSRWLDQGWDLSNWRIISAFHGGLRVGGAVVAWKTTGIDFLEDRDDVAALWDIRVAPEWRGRGIGKLLFKRAVRYAREKGCTEFKIETQDVNVKACRFYESRGCRLTDVMPDAYLGWPGETEMVWRLRLQRGTQY